MAIKQTSMPPPGAKPKAVIAIGISPKGSNPGSDPTDPNSGDDSGKASPAEAHVVKADQHCKDCENWDPTSGECAKVQGTYDPEDACLRFFKAGASGDEPDADDMGGPPDNDADDSMPPGMPGQ